MSGIGPRSANTYNAPAPSHYVAGVGRGAMGFTTRSDIGPARPAGPPPPTGPGGMASVGGPSSGPIDGGARFGQAPVGYVAGRGRGMGGGADPTFGLPPSGYQAGMGRGMGELARGQGELSGKQQQEESDRGDYSESNYDEFSGYGEKLFSQGTPYDQDDVEADNVYGAVDELMENRRKRSKEQQMLLDQKRAKTERPRIGDQFADLKRQLATVSELEWDSIPEVGDHSLKLKQSRKKETLMPMPDFILASRPGALSSASSSTNSVDPSLDATASSSSVFSGSGGQAEARGSILSQRLDSMSDSVSGQTVVDPKGYLTSLSSKKINSAAEVGDIKRARMLLQSVTTTNPKHAPGWIAAARVEEVAGKMVQARKVILQGCEQCPESEDVWIEAARLHPNETAKTILANAVVQIPTSVKIWLQAADLETSDTRKKAVLRRSLEFVPNAVNLWKAAIELETVSDARIMLARAVECVPHSVEMWLALAKLETHQNARKVLNQAREAIPTEKATWITAAKLEEANGNSHLVGRIIEKMIASLAQYQVITSREVWIAEAEDAERCGALATCAAIVRNTIHLDIEEEDRKRTWMDDAEICASQRGTVPPSPHTARAILDTALAAFPSKKSLWQQAAMLEKEFGTAESLDAKLREGVKHCPHAEVLWLMAAKEKWLSGSVPAARAILLEAFSANPESEQIWLAAVKLEWESGEIDRTRTLLNKARERASSARVWLKSSLLEVETENYTVALQLIDQAIKKYPTSFKFYLMAGQICDYELKEFVRARNYYQQGIKACPSCVPIWRSLIQLEEKVKGATKARPTAELARMKLPKNDMLWLEHIRLERRCGSEKLAESLMAKAIRECPTSGILWAEDILTCQKAARRAKSIEAVKKCDRDALVINAVARSFAAENKFLKARRWLERAAALNPKLGDAWIYLFCLEFVLTNAQTLMLNSKRFLGGRGGVLMSSAGTGPVAIRMDDATSAVGVAGATTADGGGGNNGAVDNDDEDDEELTLPAAVSAQECAGAMVREGTSSASKPVAATAGSAESDIPWCNGVPSLERIAGTCASATPNTGELWCACLKRKGGRVGGALGALRYGVEVVLGCSVMNQQQDDSA